jgi:hypothetical protein
MITIGIDPGATIGVCVYDADASCVLDTLTTRSPREAVDFARDWWDGGSSRAPRIAIERARIYAKGGAHVADTLEQVGWMIAMLDGDLPEGKQAIECCDTCWTVERRAVVSALSEAMGQQVKGDAGVWAALCALHPDALRKPVAAKDATRTKPAVEGVQAGPLYGVTGHQRAALAVAWALARHLGAQP